MVGNAGFPVLRSSGWQRAVRVIWKRYRSTGRSGIIVGEGEGGGDGIQEMELGEGVEEGRKNKSKRLQDEFVESMIIRHIPSSKNVLDSASSSSSSSHNLTLTSPPQSLSSRC